MIEIIWSKTNGGLGLDEPVDHGDNATSNTLNPTVIFVRHTGENPITDCSLYLRPLAATTYGGDFLPIDDFNEIIAAGDSVTASGFGGFQINQNAINSFPSGSWPVFTDKTSPDGLGDTFRSGFGNVSTSGIDLLTETYSASGVNGEIPTGTAPNVRFQMRVVVPTEEDVPGVRQWESVLKFTFTS